MGFTTASLKCTQAGSNPSTSWAYTIHGSVCLSQSPKGSLDNSSDPTYCLFTSFYYQINNFLVMYLTPSHCKLPEISNDRTAVSTPSQLHHKQTFCSFRPNDVQYPQEFSKWKKHKPCARRERSSVSSYLLYIMPFFNRVCYRPLQTYIYQGYINAVQKAQVLLVPHACKLVALVSSFFKN